MLQARGLFGVLALLLVVSWLVAADTKPDANKKDPDAKVKGTLPPSWKKLGLTEDQQQAIYKVQTEYRAKIEALEQEIQELRLREFGDQLEVLTDAQTARLKDLGEFKGPAALKPLLNQKVLAYAQAHLGQEVGNGECWTLVDEALKAAGADTSGDGKCVFGRSVALTALLPGDLLQFEKTHFEHREGGRFSAQDMPHHSAIVSAVEGRKVTVLNQNVNGSRKVQYSSFNLDDLQRGSLQGFRPQDK
jgi:Spy/CpxP family protein refolding chaperone